MTSSAPGEIAAMLARMNRFRDALGLVPRLFADAGLSEAEAETRALLQALPKPFGMTLDAFLAARPADHPDLLEQLTAMILKRIERLPLDRITGTRGFWTLELALSPGTLSPRPDTETLVEAVLMALRRAGLASSPLRLLDLGTGSGALLLALLSELPNATGLGVDLSGDAITTARRNAVANKSVSSTLAERAEFRAGYWFAPVSGRFDVIVSNPPYIPTGVIAGLEPEVRLHDPLLALDGGADGFDAYRHILSGAAGYLAPGGLIAVETGFDQAEDAAAIGEGYGLAVDGIDRDLGGHPRVVRFRTA